MARTTYYVGDDAFDTLCEAIHAARALADVRLVCAAAGCQHGVAVHAQDAYGASKRIAFVARPTEVVKGKADARA